ncbi:MAG: AAA family ATPase [Acidimicrobiaceae bacterium]|nr:AAA family ATPase [Acidimicrobiaceae bacterium]
MGQDPSERLARLVVEFRRHGKDSAIAVADGVATEGGSVGGYSLADQDVHLRARERFEEILRRLPTMPHLERQQLKEVWRPKGQGSYGGVGQIVQLGSFIDRASEAEWERLSGQLVALCFGEDNLADRLQTAFDEIYGLGWASATRVVAVIDPQRVIPNYSLHHAGRWAGKLVCLQLLIDEGLLDSETRHRAETVLREHPRSKPSGRAVVESNDLLLEILRPHFTDGDSVDTWGMRTFLYWLSERVMERQKMDGHVGGSDGKKLDLSTLVADFRATGYPDERDRNHQQARERHERTLQSLHALAYENREDIKPVWARSNQNYGWCGQQASLDGTVKHATEESWPGIREGLVDLCFGNGELDDRVDKAVTEVRGVGYLVATKLLAICQPGAFVPVFVLRGSSEEGQALGKLDMIELLDRLGMLDTVEASEARVIIGMHEERGGCGTVVMRSNDLLLEAIAPYFADDGVVDTWGIARFLYWLGWEYLPHEPVWPGIDEADLAVLAKGLLCDVGYLKDIVALLKDKRQVILYGPPGTGKTHFAHELAWALTDSGGDEDHPAYSLVQFHPAYSYEDFFEGFRPQVDSDGQMTYKLTSGPLVRLAERAQEHSDELHVMVIDEINRANLPRVLGELLYLLEYRKEAVQTQYRPDGDFSLPENLWFIGTMNTADRSIALIDAAMRRRFHFVPFFPDREPTLGLLRRWCEQNEPEQAWIADLLDGVNQRLHGDLGGDYMLIGPSHFMKENLDEDGLRRIWEYNIEPLIEDQFFGRQEVIHSYRFDEVWKRHGPGAAAPDAGPGPPDGPVDDDEPQSARDEGAEDDSDE